MSCKFWYAKECPLAHECSEQNFKSWNPWGWSEESCRKQVLKHLKGSGKHKDYVPKGETRDVEYEAFVEAMEISEDFYEPQETKGKKRHVDEDLPQAGAPIVARPKSMAALQNEMHVGVLSMSRMMMGGGSSSSCPAPVSRQDLREVSDSLARCVTSARHAQRLSAMAAQAFNDEAGIFEEVKGFIEAKMALLPE